MEKSSKPYSAVMDRFVEEDLKRFRQAPRALQDDLTRVLQKILDKPLGFRELSGKLRGFRKAKFGPGKNHRVIYSIDNRDRTVRYLIIGPRGDKDNPTEDIYERLAIRQMRSLD